MKYTSDKFCLLILCFILATLSITSAVTHADIAHNDTVLDLTDYEALFQAKQAVEDNKDTREYSLAGQFRQLRHLGLIRNENLQVNSLLIKAYEKMEDRTPQNLIQTAKALRYGIPFHEAIAETIKQQSSLLSYLLYTLTYFGQYDLMTAHRAPMFEVAYDCGASPIVLNGGGFSQYLSSPYPTEELKQQTLFMQECKISEQLQKQIGQKGSMRENLKRLAGEFDNSAMFDVTPKRTSKRPIAVSSTVEVFQSIPTLSDVIHMAMKNEGMMYFFMFKGARKYQFFLLGSYKGKLNLFYVADNKRPTPAIVFSMPTGKKINYFNRDMDPHDYYESVLAIAINTLMNGKKERDRVPTLESSVLMLSNKKASHFISWPDGNPQAEP